MQTLYVMRHGAAQRKAASDAERQLTEAGCAEAVTASTRFPTTLALDIFAVSPFARAQQTAKIVARECGITTTQTVCDLITPAGVVQRVDDWLNSLTWQTALLVSHQPLVGLLAEYYCGGNYRHFPTAGIVAVQGDVLVRGLCTASWVSP